MRDMNKCSIKWIYHAQVSAIVYTESAVSLQFKGTMNKFKNITSKKIAG